MLPAALAGFGLGLSLIVAIGAQNAFVLRMGLARRHVALVSLTCALSDAMLIALGVAGMGALIARNALLLDLVTLGGGLFLLAYAALSLRRALRPAALSAGGETVASWQAALAQCLAFTWLNPHVYLDTVLLVGAGASPFEGPARAAYAGGAMSASLVWFLGLGFGARLLAPLLARPAAWRLLDAAIAAVMAVLGLVLVGQLVG